MVFILKYFPNFVCVDGYLLVLCFYFFFILTLPPKLLQRYTPCNHKNKFDDQFYQVRLISNRDGWQTRTTFAKLRKFLVNFAFVQKTLH